MQDPKNAGPAPRDQDQAARLQDKDFAALVEAIPDVVYRFRFSPPHFDYISPAGSRLLGYTPEEFYADPNLVFKVVHPDDHELVRNLLAHPDQFETVPALRWIRKDGQVIWTEQHNAIVRDEAGRVTAVVGIARDITARKRAEEELERQRGLSLAAEASSKQLEDELRSSRQLLHDIIDSTPAIVFARDLDGKLILINETLARILGMPEEQALGTTDYDVFPRELADAFTATNRLVIQTGEPRQNEEVIVEDGVPHTFISHKFPLRDASGKIYGLGGVNVDITERKEMEEALRQRVEEIEKVMELVPVAIWVGHDPECRDITGNRTANQFYEAEEGENVSATATPVRRFFLEGRELPPEELPMQYSAAHNIALTDAEFEVLMPSGTRRYLLGYAVPLRHADGQVRGSIGAFVDITERKRSEQEREELLRREQAARADAEEAVGIRDRFISVASHELKTPLTSIKGYAELLVLRGQQAGLDEQFQRMAGIINTQTGRLEKMIAALLDISRIERGQLSLERGPVDIAGLVRSTVSAVRPTLKHHTIELTGADAAYVVEGDESRLEQVFQNLIQNAIKYSPGGGAVMIELSHRDGSAVVRVSDQGIGIPADDLPQLFNRFHRARNAEEYHISGLGVGLFVVREIVRLHGGEITVASQQGQGTTFTVRLPAGAG